MTASLWIIPFKVSELLPPELAVRVWSSAVIWPDVTLGAPPRPNACPSATTVSPSLSDDESANLTVGRPDTLPSIWITAMSCEMSSPTTWAEYFCERPCTVTLMLVEPLTTWLLVRISPVELISIPVPAAAPLPRTVLMSTTAGLTLAAMAAVVLLGAVPVPGVTCWIGASGEVVAWATGRLLITRARLHPIPAPAAAATTAMSTMKAAIRVQIEAGRGGGAGIHGGGGAGASDVGGESKAWSGALMAGWSGSWGFSSGIDLSSGNSLERCFVLQIAPASCEGTRRL